VETDVEQETWADPQSDVSQLLPKRIAFGDAKRSARVANVFRAVIAHHRFQSGATGHDPFRAAAKPGKEVRLDEACADADIGVGRVRSVKAMQTRSVDLISSRIGRALMGFCNAPMTALLSSGKPGLCDGSMTVARSSGRSTVKWP